MLRIGLSVYLMFATLAGPWLCCCRFQDLGARFVTLLRPQEAAPAGSSHSCCRHRRPVKESEPRNHHDSPSCPCQGTRQEQPALVLLVADESRQLDRDANMLAVDLADGNILAGVVLLSVDRIRTSSSLSAPIRSGRDILSSLHILRC